MACRRPESVYRVGIDGIDGMLSSNGNISSSSGIGGGVPNASSRSGLPSESSDSICTQSAVYTGSDKKYPPKIFAIFSAIAWNFKEKFYRHIKSSCKYKNVVPYILNLHGFKVII